MNVEGVGQNRINPAVRGPDAAADQSQARPGGQPEPARQDQVSLSEKARELQSATKAVEAAADVREDRIAELQRQIAEGTYHVPAETLARKILGGA